MKKFVSSFVLVGALTFMSITSFALEGFKTINREELPKHIKPLEFKTEQEAEKYVKSVEVEKNKNIRVINNINVFDNSNPFLYSLGGDKYGHKMNILSSWGVADLRLNVDFYFNWGSRQKQNIFTELKGLNVSLNGATPGQEWVADPKACWGDIVEDSKRLFCSVNGTYKWYLIVSGTVKLQEKAEHYKSNFYSPGKHNW